MMRQYSKSSAWMAMTLFAATTLAVAQSGAGQRSGVSKPPAAHPYTDSIPAADGTAASPATSGASNIDPSTMPSAPAAITAPAPMPEPRATLRRAEDGTDDGLVNIREEAQDPKLQNRKWKLDPDEDIVEPHGHDGALLTAGTLVRVRLMTRLSTSTASRGEEFRARVANDVMDGDVVVIPAGAEITGHVAQVSEGKLGGRGSMRLVPETVTLPDGSQYGLRAIVASAPGSGTHVTSEGVVQAGSGWARAGIQYGAVVGAGAVTGAIVGGPVGAGAGAVVGAGIVTAHLLITHPQAVLEKDAVLTLMLTERVALAPQPATQAGN